VQSETNLKRYIFQADAIGVAGQFTHPFNDIIPAQAATALPSDGGLGASRVEGFRHKEILSFSSASTEVVGKEIAEGVYETISTSVVENFNLLDTVTCDRMVARLEGKYPCGNGDSSGCGSELCVVPLGSRFEGLRIGDIFFEILEVAPDYFCRPDRACWTGLENALRDEEERRMLAPLSLPGRDGIPVPLPADGQRQDVLGFCIALDPRPGSRLGAPLCFQVPEFGTVHLGEFFCYPSSRQLSMLRVELRHKHHGHVVGAQTMVRPEPYPP